MNNKLIIITGPTASGKSSFAVNIAKDVNGEIISCDSMQIYKCMSIGTAKISQDKMQGVPHYLIDFLDPEEEFSVADYVTMAHEKIMEIQLRKKTPILVGGTTLYIQSILDNIQFFEIPKDLKLRNNLEDFAKIKGNHLLWQELKKVDPELAQKLHENNIGRIIRGIEAFRLTGKTLSYWQEESTKVPSPYHINLIGLSYENRQNLYDKINKRVDSMITDGLLDEIESLKKRKLSQTAQQAIGYKEFWDYASGKCTLEDSVKALKMQTRRYAKRQLTWMRSRKELYWLYRDHKEDNEILIDSLTYINNGLKGSE